MLLICFIAFSVSVQAQKKPAKKSEPESLEVQLKELKKQLEEADPEERKIMEEMGLLDMIKNLEKQMGQLKQSGQYDKVMEEAANMAMINPNKIPDKPSALVVPATPVGKEQLKAYLQPIMRNTEAAIKPNHKAAIAKHLNKGKETGVIGMGYFANNELDKALYLLLNASITNPEDYASLNNLGALITMSGYAHKSLPILQYVQQTFPQSPTLLNNIGQAWLSLGQIDKAEKFLKDALAKDEENAEAAYSLALVAQHKGNPKLCATYATQAAKHCASPEITGLILEYAPDTDIASLVRPRFKQFYKTPDITKQIKLLSAPMSYSEQESRKGELLQFIEDLKVTHEQTESIADKLMSNWAEENQKYIQAMQQSSLKLQSPEDVKKHMQKFAPHPLKYLATIMIGSMHNPLLEDSYASRIRKEQMAKSQRHKDLLASLSGIDNQITATYKQMDKLEPECDGEGENKGCEGLRQQLCQLNNQRARQYNNGLGENRNRHIDIMEQLLNERLREEIFWTIIAEYPKDPKPMLYDAYNRYLSDLKQVGEYFGLTAPFCTENNEEKISKNGKLRQWELDHCNFSFGFNALVVGGKMDCSGMKMYVELGAGKVEYGESINPATWETTGRSISVEAGKSKEFEVTKNIKAEAGASVKTTVKFDGSGNISDIAVRGSVGASVSGPMGGSVGAELGSAEVSLRGGFNSSGPSVNSPGSSFLRD